MATNSLARPLEEPKALAKIIVASAAGTLIEWYDFYIFGSLATVLAARFYPPGNDTFALIAYLATFAAGFVVRPFGALFFGKIGDHFGRRLAFIITLTIMGFSTTAIGLMPTFKTAGWFSPITLILIRVLQGLAVGGEYGGAAVYVAEHVADDKRGFYTSFIQITATLGLFVSLGVILITQESMSAASFNSWGWRLPFLFSVILVTMSLVIRSTMKESPIFQRMKETGAQSTNPLVEAFTNWSNLKQVIISLMGATAGQAVVWYAGQFYALFYLQTILKVPGKSANIIVAIALLLGMPFFSVFGWLSDRIGRKKLMMAGMLLAVVLLFPIYHGMQAAAGNDVVALTSEKDRVTGSYKLTPMTIATDATGSPMADPETGKPVLVPAKVASSPNRPVLVFLIWLQVMFACLIYGPLAAYLVEAFPAKVRYTSVSLPYHIGSGVFGGLLPLIGLSLCAATGNIYAGLIYPTVVAGISLVCGSIFLKETRGTLIWEEPALFGPMAEETGDA